MVNKPTSSLLDYYHDGTQTCLGLDKRVLAVLTAERLGPIFGVACFKKCRYLGLNSTFALAVAGARLGLASEAYGASRKTFPNPPAR